MDEKELYSALGKSIAARRRELGKTQAEVGSAVNLSRPSMANIERGNQKVLLHQVYLLAEALDLDDVSKLLPLGFFAQRRAPAPAPSARLAAPRLQEPGDGLTVKQRAQINDLLAQFEPSKRPATRNAKL